MSTDPDTITLAREHYAAGRLAEAAALFQEVLRAEPKNAHAWHELGCIALALGPLETAESCFVRAIRLDGGHAAFHNNLGDCYITMGKLAAAEASLEQALRLDADNVAARVNLCLLMHAVGRSADAERRAREAMDIEPVTAEEHATIAKLALILGDWTAGWWHYEWRLALPAVSRPALEGPRWDGRPLDGRAILLLGEQGCGDVLQFARYVPAVIRRGGRPILYEARDLLPLLAEAKLCELAPADEAPPHYAVHYPLMSLPFIFGTTPETVPRAIPYLRARPQLSDQWRERLASETKFRVGICWQGSPAHRRDRLRSIPLHAFAPLARVPHVRLVSLQRHAGVEQLDALAGQFEVLDLRPDYDREEGAFLNAAAVIENLDLVITADTAIAHLAGALGAPVWTVLPIVPDWRWMLAREDTPWYPTMRLFRQARSGDWSEVIGRVAEALAAHVAAQQRSRSRG